MAERFPPIDPYEAAMLDVGDGRLVYWEQSGNAGKAGPALARSAGERPIAREAPPVRPHRLPFRAIRQRGCGRSTPSAGEFSTGLSTNTTGHLISDIEQLRRHLGIELWLVWGGSRGVTLGLACAERYPAHVSEMVLSEMVLASVTVTRLTTPVGSITASAAFSLKGGTSFGAVEAAPRTSSPPMTIC